jgi:tetratricopeptide (TPR) repeat protein
MREDRYQQALELAKSLYKDEPTAPHRELLERAYLGRARQLRGQGCLRDARTVLEKAAELDGEDPRWLEQMATELASCGEVSRALQLASRLPDASVQSRIVALAVDQAVQQGPAGRTLLPESLQTSFDHVLRSFALEAAGSDEVAREALQTIGLQSPFLEWKLLLRGLLAYYQNDDARAIENWQRLNPDRLPARVAAPLRFRIDRDYQLAQPPEAQTALQQQADQLQASPLVNGLRSIQAVLCRDRPLAQAFRQADNLMPQLRKDAPQLIPRLAACFYWSIIQGGQPDDLQRYRRTFGTPPDDPEFARLQALVMEQIPDMPEAHRFWQAFERSVANNPTAWPGDQGQRVRALVWWHMGNNAANVPNMDHLPNLPPFLRDHPGRPKALKPSAEQCFQQSLKLAPDQLETYEALFHYYRDQDQKPKAIKAALRLLEKFPDHLATLDALGHLYMGEQEYADALTMFQRASRVNPLDRRLRSQISTAHLFHARTFAEAGRFDEARAEYQASLASVQGQPDGSVLCKWAACEFKAGEPARAEELLQEALAQAGSHLAVAYSMVIEAIRLKLPRPLKTRFDKEFNSALAEPPTAPAAVAIAVTAATHQVAGIQYHGQKTHEKKVQTYLDMARRADFSEDQLEKVCQSLLELRALKLLREYTALGEKRFPKNPFFPFMEAESYIALGPHRCPAYRVRPLLDKARRLLQAAPKDSKHQELQEKIDEREQMVGFNPFGAPPLEMLESIFGSFLDEDGFEDEDEFD